MLTTRVMEIFIRLRDYSRLATAWLIFSCLLICSVPLSAQRKFAPADSVFCPLQKTWVKRNQPTQSIDNSLNEICAPNEHKQHFVYDLAKSLFSKRVESTQITQEQLFFQYLEKGRQVFAEIAPFRNSPDRRLVNAAAKEKSGTVNYNVDFHRKTAESFNLKVLARPPTFNHDTNFDFQFAQELKKISRHINPRSPPSFI